jgi:ribosomal protein L10
MRPVVIQKEKIVREIQNKLQDSKATIFYNFHHIDNEKLFALKKDLKKV